MTLTFDSWTTDRKTAITDQEYQLDIGSSLRINSNKCLKAAHRSEATSGPANKANNIAISNHVEIRNYYVEVGGIRYPKDSIDVKILRNDYVN